MSDGANRGVPSDDDGFKGPSVRANHRLLALCGALGGVIGLATGVVASSQRHGPDGADVSLLTAPLPAWLAVAIAVLWGIVLPVISWRWHRVVDEHEREAYRDGAVAGYYVIGIGAPVWWFLWRGGLLPPVEAFWFYVAFMLLSGTVWVWRKYR